jgi:cysteine desulfurase
MIYLDNSATTKIDEEVLSAMLPWFRDDFGNASSVYAIGRKARVAIESAREEIAGLICAHPAEILFTSGGTESNNTVLKSCVHDSGFVKRIVHTAIEHHAILHPAEELARAGTEVVSVPVNEQGYVDCAMIRASATHWNTRTTLISVMHGNNEIGTIQPLTEIRSILPEAYIHTDAVQTFGKIPFDVQSLGVDFATLSAHKIHGPKGIGALFIRKGIDFKAHQQGGAQERNRRGGTEAVALIVGMQVAARRAYQEMQQRTEHMIQCTELLRTLLSESIPQLRINTPTDHALPHIVNVSFCDAEHLDGEALLAQMDMRGIAVSNGSACVSGSLQPSHVLEALGLSVSEAKAGVRFSVSKDTTTEEVRAGVFALAEVIADMRTVSS